MVSVRYSTVSSDGTSMNCVSHLCSVVWGWGENMSGSGKPHRDPGVLWCVAAPLYIVGGRASADLKAIGAHGLAPTRIGRG